VDAQVQNIIADMQQAEPDSPGAEVLFPGERVLRKRQENLSHGNPVDETVWQAILKSRAVFPADCHRRTRYGTRYSRDPLSFERMNSSEIRDEFLIADLFTPDEITLLYLLMDRMIVGSAVPTRQPLWLNASPEMRAAYFAERREIGIFNIGEVGIGSSGMDRNTAWLTRMYCILGAGQQRDRVLQRRCQPAGTFLHRQPPSP
jgi:hypothetical protein